MINSDDKLFSFTTFLFSIYLFPLLYICTFVASLALGNLVFIFPVGLTMFWVYFIHKANKRYDLEKISEYAEELEEIKEEKGSGKTNG